MIDNVHFSSKTDDWATPQEFFDNLNHVFNFDMDVCATEENAKCPDFIDPVTDGLREYWNGKCWMNPPYGRGVIDKWVKKAFEHSDLVVCLLPARTDTRWWQDYCMKADVIHFVKGRLKFGDGKNSAPFPSAVVIFNLFKR